MVLDTGVLGGNAPDKAKPQIARRPCILYLAIRAVGIKFGEGLDVLGGIGVYSGEQISGFAGRTHGKCNGPVANIHAIDSFYGNAPLKGFCQIRTA